MPWARLAGEPRAFRECLWLMDGYRGAGRRWVAHGAHGVAAAVYPGPWGLERRAAGRRAGGCGVGRGWVELDGSRGEGGGQILRTALSLSLLTGRPFRLANARANREKPGLRPQHVAAVKAAAALGGAEVEGASVGSRVVRFRPSAYEPRDLTLDIGTAGATALVLQTLHLPLALRASAGVRVSLTGGTFNEKAPSYPFLASTWAAWMGRIGLAVAIAMPRPGFYPYGGGVLEAWVEPGTPRGLVIEGRGGLRAIRGVAATAGLKRGEVAARMRARALERLGGEGLAGVAEIEVEEREGGPGAWIELTAEFEGLRGGTATTATFVGLGARGKPAERVADEAVDELLGMLGGAGAVDAHTADQLLLPLSFAAGASAYTVGAVTEHLRTNVGTIGAFVGREIRVEEDEEGAGRVVIGAA